MLFRSLAKSEIEKYSKNDWKEITLETFNSIFKDSAIKRATFEGIKRNINAAL